MTEPVEIRKLPTGVPGLDAVLGGGLPELSFNLIAGGPGSGKTTLAHQIMFASASRERPALYITILGEPPIKMLRYQQQFAFFEPAKIPDCVRFLHLGAELMDGGLQAVLDAIVREVEAADPRMVFVDSFRSVVRKAGAPGQMDLQSFVQRLGLHLTGWEATTFLIGEYEDHEADSNPIFTVADGIIWLSQATHRTSTVRRAQVVKMRGQGSIPGLHTVKISSEGLQVYPRLSSATQVRARPERPPVRRKTGVDALDAMMGGGIPAGYTVLIAGPPGSGKTVLSTQFIRAGIANGERGVIAMFEKRPDGYLAASGELQRLADEGALKLLHLRSLDLSVEEGMAEIAEAVRELGASRVVIDPLMGLELALAPSFREDFRESLHRLIGGLADLGVTVVMTAELVDARAGLRLAPPGISFLADGLIVQRYVELGGELRKVLAVAKLRGCDHAKDLRPYDIGPGGIVMEDGGGGSR